MYRLTFPADPAIGPALVIQQTLPRPPAQGVSLRNLGLIWVCLSLGVYGVLTSWLVPISLRVAYDPSIQYMLTSLAWFRGTPYVYTDHPGTPVEILGTLLLLLSHPFVRHASELISFHLSHPQYFLSVAQTLLVVASLGVCVWLGCRAVRVTHWSCALLAVALSGLFFAIHPLAFATLAEWSHESFNFPAGTGFSLGLLMLVRRPNAPRWPWVIAFGAGAGVLTSIQVYFAAWVVGTAVSLSIACRLHGAPWRSAIARTITVIAAAAAGFLVATLPIRDRYSTFFSWLWSLTTHQGTYGYGVEGFSTPELMASNSLAEFGQAPILCLAVLAIGGIVVWRLLIDAGGSRRDVALWSAGLGLTGQSLVVVVLAAKHPGLKYLLPLAATLPILLAAALGTASITRTTAALAALLGTLGILALVASFSAAMFTHLSQRDALTRGDTATELLLNRIAQDRGVPRPQLRTLWTYGTMSSCYALWFGDETTGQAFNQDIGQLCPLDLNLSVFSARVIAPGTSVPVGEFSDWDVALVPREIATTRADAVPSGEPVVSSLPSLGLGDVLVFLNPEARS